MEHDPTFRLVLGATLAALLPVGVYHRVRSQASGERLDRRQEGWFVLATLRPLALVHGVALIGWLIDPRWMRWSFVELPVALRWIGAACGVAGLALATWAFRSLGRNLTDTVVTRRDHELVTSGPYAWVRHPFYDAAALLVLADSLMAANWFLAASGFAVLAVLVRRTTTEERNLVTRFGDDYRRYMRRTGRFLPRRVR